MKFNCEKDILDQAFTIAGRAAATRSGSLQVLSGLHLELKKDDLVITATDLDLTIQVTAEVGGKEDGSTVLPAKLAGDIVRALPSGQIEISMTDDGVTLSSGRSNFNLRTMSVDDFPKIEPATGNKVTLNAAGVEQALDQVVTAASGDDSRPILTGVMLAAEDDGLRFVATDSYRLAVRDLPGTSILSTDQTVLVPSRTLEALGKLLSTTDELTISLGERQATFYVNNVQITTTLITGEFPNYRGLIPDHHPNNLIVDKGIFLDALRRVRLLAQENTPVRLSMTAEVVELIAITQDVGQASEIIDAEYVGEDLVVAFNPTYLLEGFEVSPGDEIRLETIDSLKPAVIRSVVNDEFLYLLMPVRVS